MANPSLPEIGSPVDVPSTAYARSGIYFLLLGGEVVYVGQAIDMRKRIGNHLVEAVKHFDSVCCVPCGEQNLLKLERFFIEKFVPRYNNCRIAKQLKRFERGGWDRKVDPLPATDATLNESEAAAFLGLSLDELRALGGNGPPSYSKRRCRSRSRYRVFPLGGLVAFSFKAA